MRIPVFLLALGLLSVRPALSAPDPLETCAAQKNDAARLACFDRQMALRHGAHTGTSEVSGAQPPQPPAAASQGQSRAAQPPPPAPQAARDPNFGLQGAQLRKKLKEEGRHAQAPSPVSATVARLVPLTGTEYAFELDNGQIWQQTDSRPGLSVKVNDQVTISPGILGDFFFTTSHRQRIRVKRIR